MRGGVSFSRQSSPLGSPQPLMSPGATANETVIIYSIRLFLNIYFIIQYVGMYNGISITAKTTNDATSAV
jgi:hypothetical protein